MKRHTIHNENTLLKGLKKGDKNSYKILFDTYYQDLCNYTYKLSSDTLLAEDLVQNIFLKIWEKKETLNINTSLKSYLFKSCYNEFLMHLRKQKKDLDVLETLKWEALSELFGDEDNDKQEAHLIQLESAIEKLPEKCKKVFKLSRIEQKKHKEIAEILGISTKTVEVHIGKALRYLKTNISNFLFF